MKVKELKQFLVDNENSSLIFVLTSLDLIPKHFHVTEIGKIEKTFIDCGGTFRKVNNCLIQLWTANDLEHRLTPAKLLKIFSFAESLELDDLEIQIEYGEKVASQYFLEDVIVSHEAHKVLSELILVLNGKKTDCLAPDKCGVNGSNCC